MSQSAKYRGAPDRRIKRDSKRLKARLGEDTNTRKGSKRHSKSSSTERGRKKRSSARRAMDGSDESDTSASRQSNDLEMKGHSKSHKSHKRKSHRKDDGSECSDDETDVDEDSEDEDESDTKEHCWRKYHGVLSYVAALWVTMAVSYLIGIKEYTGVAVIYGVLFAILVPIRLITYCIWKRSEFVLDVCYFINTGVLVYIFAIPENGTAHNVAFIMSHTLPAFAGIIYQNAYDLSKYGQLSSCLIHLGPPLIMSLIRWNEATTLYGGKYGKCFNDDSLWCSPWLACGIGCGSTLLHAIPYMLITFTCNKNRLKDPEYLNNFIYLNQIFTKTFKIMRERSLLWRKLFFMFVYSLFPVVLAPLAVVWWSYMYADYALLCTVFVSMSIAAAFRQNQARLEHNELVQNEKREKNLKKKRMRSNKVHAAKGSSQKSRRKAEAV